MVVRRRARARVCVVFHLEPPQNYEEGAFNEYMTQLKRVHAPGPVSQC